MKNTNNIFQRQGVSEQRLKKRFLLSRRRGRRRILKIKNVWMLIRATFAASLVTSKRKKKKKKKG
jgi:hypothetical protein